MGRPHLGLTTVLLSAVIALGNTEDLPCRARDVGIPGRSIVCVCDATYCDTITRDDPSPGTFVAYTSSDAGQRFEKSYGEIQTVSDPEPDTEPEQPEEVEGDGEEEERLTNIVIRLYPLIRYQYIEGFGGSVTDAAAINWRKLSDAAQTHFINSYFSRTGLEYNLIRVPIGGADFSTHPYTYNEDPWYDHALSNYSLTSEDYFLKLPMIKRSQAVATDEVKITASTWSPPVWMKTNERITGFGRVRREYYQAYADYHIRFLEEYEKAEVKIWAITTTNEPINGIVGSLLVSFNSLGWTPRLLGRWVANNLGPTVRNSRFNKTLILAVDDQRYNLPIYLGGMEREDPKSIEYIDGIAVHYYGNFIPPIILTAIQRRYPDKILLSTEACEGPMPWDREKVEIGSWDRARKYTKYILQDLNNYVVGWIDWNLCLDPQGGPNWANNFVDAPILVYGDQDEFIKQPMFYAMGHFSKFIPRSSRRIRSARRSLFTVENAAFLTPSGNIVMVLQNTWQQSIPGSSCHNPPIIMEDHSFMEDDWWIMTARPEDSAAWRNRPVNLRINLSTTRFIQLIMEARSIKTIEINHN